MDYTTRQAADLLGVSIRSIQRYCKREGIINQRNTKTVSAALLEKWRSRIEAEANAKISAAANLAAEEKRRQEASNDATEGDSDTTEGDYVVEVPAGHVVEVLTPEQKAKLEEIIINDKVKAAELKQMQERIKDYQNQTEYLRKQYEGVMAQKDKLVDTFKEQLKVLQQRAYIEAKEKKMD